MVAKIGVDTTDNGHSKIDLPKSKLKYLQNIDEICPKFTRMFSEFGETNLNLRNQRWRTGLSRIPLLGSSLLMSCISVSVRDLRCARERTVAACVKGRPRKPHTG